MKASSSISLLMVALAGILIGAALVSFVGGGTLGLAAPAGQAQTVKSAGPVLTPEEAKFLLFRYLTDWVYGKPLDQKTRADMLAALFVTRSTMSASYQGDGIYIVELQAGYPLPGQGIQQWKLYDRLATYDLVFYEPASDSARTLFSYFYSR